MNEEVQVMDAEELRNIDPNNIVDVEATEVNETHAKEELESVEAEPMIEIKKSDNTIINNFIQTLDNSLNIINMGDEYGEVVNEFFNNLLSESLLDSVEDGETHLIFTYNFQNIFNHVNKVLHLLNEFGDKLDSLKSSRYTGRSNIKHKRF